MIVNKERIHIHGNDREEMMLIRYIFVKKINCACS